MDMNSHLWAIGYDDPARADQVREEIAKLGWDKPYLILQDLAVVVRHPDGSFTLNHEPFPAVGHVLSMTLVGLLAGLVLAAPLAGSAIGAVLGVINSGAATLLRIDAEFIRDVERVMKPGTSALFVLDDQGDMGVILHAIQGLGGTILKTNVDRARARLIQSALSVDKSEETQRDLIVSGSR